MRRSLERTERARLLNRYKEALAAYDEQMDDSQAFDPWSEEEVEALHVAEAHLAVVVRLEEQYFAELPRLALSCCPFDERPLYRTFDPFGLDGLWWRSDVTPEEPPCCRHFCALTGAINFGVQKPAAGSFEVRPGPEVPYVIPRLLQLPGMVAVVSQLTMDNGYAAYPVAYFAERRPPPQELCLEWRRTQLSYTTQMGESGWTVPADDWDFDLGPWLEAGKLRWCTPKTAELAPRGRLSLKNPYVDLPGERSARVLRGDMIWSEGADIVGKLGSCRKRGLG